MVQWIRIHLPLQGTQAQSLLQEDSTCLGATKPPHHNYRAHTPRACALKRESMAVRRPGSTGKSSPHSPQLEKAAEKQGNPTQPKISQYIFFNVLFFNFWLCWVFFAFSVCREWGPPSSCGVWVSPFLGFSCCRAWARGVWASVAVAHWLSRPMACGTFLDQGSNWCPLHCKADS